MLKLYGPDERYETILKHRTKKKRNKAEKKHSKENVTTYTNINPIVDHTSLLQEEFIHRARRLVDDDKKSLIDRIDISKKNEGAM